MPKQLDFQKAICPICNKEYVYISYFKPVTCNNLACVHEAHKRGLIYADTKEEVKNEN